MARCALALALLAPLFGPTAAGAQVTIAPGVYQLSDPNQALTFDGRGWGHGIGLCQWGARGRALAGQTGEQIIAAYYTGTAIQRLAQPDTAIRVLVDSGRQLDATKTETITGTGPWVLETAGAAPVPAPAGATLELRGGPAASGGSETPLYAVKAGGAQLAAGDLRGPLTLRAADPSTRFVVGYKPAGEVAGRPGAYYDAYRGDLALTQRDNGLETVNRLPLEDYLRGVVPGEMPALWPGEALKAQAYAARSYAFYQVRTRSGERYDVDDTTAFQVYLGANVEHPSTNAVIDATAGQVVTYAGQVAQAYFFSTCAGWTENNESVWAGQPLPYLRGIRDVDASGRPYDAGAPRSAWSTGALTVSQLERLLDDNEATEVGRLLTIDLSRRAPSWRLLQVTITGTAGTKTVRADTLMTRFNRGRPSGVAQLYSTNFDLTWAPQSALLQSQGGVPATPTAGPPPATRTPSSSQPTPTPRPAGPSGAIVTPPVPTPTAVPTPVYHLEYTAPAQARPTGSTNAYFQETGHNVGGAFLSFFNSQGGLDTFGLPRTEELLEDGRTVQYFQRARFEFHTDQAGTPYEVQLMLLGDALTAPRRPFPTVAPFASDDQHRFFAETGHGLHYAFLGYWRARGGLDVFGYPISEELYGENGWPYAVQYFQRARFEYHPEHAGTPYEVQLGLLGDQYLQQRLWLK